MLIPARSALRNANLSNLTGIAFERGMFRRLACRTCGEDQFSWQVTHCCGCGRKLDDDDKLVQRSGLELLQAADVYAVLHRQVWGKLPSDIESDLINRYGPEALRLLREVGRIKGPAPPQSHFRKLVASTDRSEGGDPEEDLKRRLRYADRYGEALVVLRGNARQYQRRCAVVENIIIWHITPVFLQPDAPRNPRIMDDERAFQGGLFALADHFGLFDKRERSARHAANTESS